MRTDTAGGLQSVRDEILKNIDVRQLQQVIDKLGIMKIIFLYPFLSFQALLVSL